MKKTLSYCLLLFGQCLFVLVFGTLILQIIFSMKSPDSIFKDVSSAKMAIYALCIGGILISFCSNKTMFFFKYGKGFMLGAWLVWFVLQGLYIYSTYSQTGSDSFVVSYHAWNITHNLESDEFFWQYFARYQNNIPLLILLLGCCKLLGNLLSYSNLWMVLAITAALFADLAIYWTVKLSGAICKRKTSILFAFVSAVLFIGLSEEASIIYSDIAVLWTIPCSLYFYFMAFEKRKKVFRNVVLSGIVIGLGGVFKPQVFVVAVSIFIIRGLYLIYWRNNKVSISNLKYLISFFTMMLFVYFSLFHISYYLYASILPEQYNGKNYLVEQKYPIAHWINMGLNEYFGAYSVDDVDFTGNISGLEEKKTALKLSIRQRLENKSLKDLIVYENHKVVLAIQNGTFSQDMVWKGQLLNHSTLALRLQPYFVASYPQWKNGLGLIIQILYIFVIILCLYAEIRYLYSGIWFEESFIQIMTVSLIGGICFIILLERNMRYFYSMLPILIVLTAKGVSHIASENHVL